MSIKEFRQLLQSTYKSRDTEENIDIYFTRPIGMVITLVCKRLGIHPNAVTIFSFFLGIAAGWMFYHTDLVHNIYGVLLLMAANFCDSADGQLARMTGKKTLTGRMLDGFASDVWFLSVYVAICLRLQGELMPGLDIHWGIGIWLLGALAGFIAHARQARLADYYRNIHLFFLLGSKGSELNSYESQRAIYNKYKAERNFVGMLFFYNYANYCHAQEAATPQFQRLRQRLVARYGSMANIPQDVREDFCRQSLPLMKYTNFLTHNWRAFVLFFSCLINRPWIYLMFEVTVMYAVVVYMHKRHEGICRNFCNGPVEQPKEGYLFDFGGTLDTRGEHWSKVLWRAYQKAEVPVSWDDFWQTYCNTERRLGSEQIIMPYNTFRHTLDTKIEMQLEWLTYSGILKLDRETLKKMHDQILETAYNEVEQVTAESKKALDGLQRRNIPMVLVSNFYGNINTVLREFKLSQYFVEVIESADVNIRKPDPRIWQLGIEALQKHNPELTPADITVVGDSQEKDIQPAQSLGCKTILRSNRPLEKELNIN